MATLRAEPETGWRVARRAVILVVLAAVPVVFDTSVRPSFALPKFTVVLVGAALVAATALAERVAGRPSRQWRNGLELPVLVLVGWTALSAAASDEPATGLFGTRDSLNGLATTAAFAILFFGIAEAFDRSQVRTALSVLWFGAGGAVLLYAAVQLRDRVVDGGRWDFIGWRNWPGEEAIWSSLGNPNHLAGFLAILLPVGLVLTLLARTAPVRGLSVLMLTVLLVVMVVVASRGALAGAAAAVVALGSCLWREIRDRWRGGLLLAGAVMAVVAVAAAAIAWSGHTNDKLGDLLHRGEGTTVDIRVEMWQAAWRMAEEHPLLGVGPDGYGAAFDAFRSERFLDVFGPQVLGTDPHNLFLSHMATRGFPGLVGFVYLLGAAGRRLLPTLRSAAQTAPPPVRRGMDEDRALLAAVIAGLLAYLVQASFNRHEITLDLCFWTLLGLGCVLAGACEWRPSGPHESGNRHGDGHRANSQGDPRDEVVPGV